jgi:methyltransferase
MVTHWLFLFLIVSVAAQRLFELRLSKRNQAVILSKGGREYPSRHFTMMKILHAVWLPAALLEVVLFQRPFIPWMAAAALFLFFTGQILRYAAIKTLGWRWTVNVMTIPGEPPVEKGIYRFIRHPNYLGVALEILALPLMHTAYLTAGFFSIANALVLYSRIRSEESALDENNQYSLVFKNRPRFFPRPARNAPGKGGTD